jgi:hypothetical protein
VVLANGIRTLVDVVIVNPTQTNLVFQVVSFRGMVTMVVIQVKKKLYHN